MKKLNQLFKFLLFSFVLFLPNVSLKAQLDDYYSALLVCKTDTGVKAEQALVSRLEGIGFEVTIKSEATVVDGDIQNFDLIIVSASVASGTVATALPSLPTTDKPVIIWEPFLYDFMGFQAADGGEYNSNKIKIVKNDHALAAKIALGELQVSSTTKGYSYGKPEGKPTIIATNPADSTQAVIFAYDKGDSMASTTAPERRVGFYLLNDASDTSLSVAGWALFDAAVYWSIHKNPAGISNKNLFKNSSNNYPNPFNLKTDISFSVPTQSYVRLSVYNMLGEKVATLADEMKSAGNYVVTFKPTNLPYGTYIYTLEVGSNVISKKMLYVK